MKATSTCKLMDAMDAMHATGVMDPMDESLALEVCLAVRQNDLEVAQAAFEKIIAVQDDAAYVALVKLALLAALRKEQELMAQHWLEASSVRLKNAFAKEALAGNVSALLESWCFASCDHRLENVQAALTALVRQWFKAAGARAEAQALEKELLNMAARMLRRGWQPEARWLLRLLAWRALRYSSLVQWQGLLSQLVLHFTVYARWESFPKACEVYHELTLLLLVLVRRAGRPALPQAERAAFLQLALRSVRALVTNIARSTMQEDMDIFRQWYQYLWQLAGEDAARKQHLLVLLQLSISYWHSTLPKSSKKQLRFLKDLLQPNLLSEEYEALLARIA
ncbi:MAG: hypothetical protein ACI3WS_03530 [Phascolarctobacterium sp.]